MQRWEEMKKRKSGLKAKKARKVAKVLHEFKAGSLHIGKSKKTVKSRKQAVAIALSQSRKIKR